MARSWCPARRPREGHASTWRTQVRGSDNGRRADCGSGHMESGYTGEHKQPRRNIRRLLYRPTFHSSFIAARGQGMSLVGRKDTSLPSVPPQTTKRCLRIRANAWRQPHDTETHKETRTRGTRPRYSDHLEHCTLHMAEQTSPQRNGIKTLRQSVTIRSYAMGSP